MKNKIKEEQKKYETYIKHIKISNVNENISI